MSIGRRGAMQAGIAALGSLLVGCALPRADSATQRERNRHREIPLLRLPPNALGKTMAEQQRLTLLVPNRTPQTLDVLLEADTQSVRLALMQLGQVAAQLVWDGTDLQVTRSRWWPSDVSAERILSDMQLTYWPLDAIQSALPAGWNIADEGAVRVLRDRTAPDGSPPEITIRTDSPSVREVIYRAGWRLRIEAISLAPRPDDQGSEVRR